MTPIPFGAIVEWIMDEYDNYNTIFGVRKSVHIETENKIKLFDEHMELPFGPAAGPHTQLTQNIVAAYVAGCRFFELKTVQTLDGEDLPVSKPCINAKDEGYNVEWSTELTINQAFEEYVKAWFILKLISREYDFGDADGFIFNMSVGYDYEGITSNKIDKFIEGLKNASTSPIWDECKSYIVENINRFNKIDEAYVENISPNICTSITLSTLHGCPPEEIERIASHLLKEKGINTFVKCNPTLLGYEYARNTLDTMGYDYLVFDDFHFKDDLQYEDAVPMFQRLMKSADENNLIFGVKLTNTFPVKIANNELPGEEMYMSGRSLYPLSIALAYKLAKTFDGKLKISYSGGAFALNIDKIAQAGIWPITIATTLLKSGGYERCRQIAEALKPIDNNDYYKIDTQKLKELRDEAINNNYYSKPLKQLKNNKINKKVPLIDCYVSPCKYGCPINQDIPHYIDLAEEGKYEEALNIIIDRNPLPFITGTICSHNCTSKCTRNFYDESVKIRDIKLQVAKKGYDSLMKGLNPQPEKVSDARVAVIGGGPAGLAASYFLAKAGIDVTIYEKRNSLGGIVKHVIPEFRIPTDHIENDINLIKKMGVKIVLNKEIDDINELKALGYKYIILAIGAWNPINLKVDGTNPIDALDFLENVKCNENYYDLGENVVVVGGGNTAMDTARAAKRTTGVKNVYLVYRRTKKYMPADEEELLLTIEDGVIIQELLSPTKYENGNLICNRMALGDIDESGRRRPVKTEESIDIPADSIISAIGQKTDIKLFNNNDITMENGSAKIDKETYETDIDNVYVAGDALRGPSTVVESIADAIKVTLSLIKKEDIATNEVFHDSGYNHDLKKELNKKGIIEYYSNMNKEIKRCLQCGAICENCVDVCPNRANVAIHVDGKSMNQIIHIDRMCNECGNCETFCPYQSAPYRDKFTLFNTEEDFMKSTNQGFYMIDQEKKECKIRLDDNIISINLNTKTTQIPEDIYDLIATVCQKYSFLMR